MKIIKQPMNKLLLDAMNINKRYNRPFQLQVNVTRTMAILRHSKSIIIIPGRDVPFQHSVKFS